jgi:hypothetical protein
MAAKSPTEQLKEWTQTLATAQSQNADLSKEMERLKGQIDSLAKSVSDIDQKKQAWEKGAQAAGQQQADFATYVKTKTTMLEASVADPKTIVDAKKAALQAIADLQTALDKATATVAAKQQDWADAKAAAAVKANAYNSYAGLAASNDAILKDLASLRVSADKEGAANNVARMYFLVLVMADVLNKVVLPDPAAYTAELNSRASDLAGAGEVEKLAKIAADKASADLAQAQKNLDDAGSKWRQNVLDSIPNGGAGAAVPPAGNAPAAQPAAVPPAGNAPAAQPAAVPPAGNAPAAQPAAPPYAGNPAAAQPPPAGEAEPLPGPQTAPAPQH